MNMIAINDRSGRKRMIYYYRQMDWNDMPSSLLPVRLMPTSVCPAQSYDPGRLLDHLLLRLNLTRDNDLARILKMDKRLLSMVRHGQRAISGSMLLRMQDATGLTILELRCLLQDRRRTSRMVCRSDTTVHQDVSSSRLP
jgi:plasmid maintenance system antidote protein VapI